MALHHDITKPLLLQRNDDGDDDGGDSGDGDAG